jgi:hypothetical protein
MRKFFITFFVLLSCYVLWPYLVVFNLYVALKTGDTGGVEERVDWAPLKEGLTKDLDQLVAKELKKNLRKEGIQVSFGSLTLSKEISEKIGTPAGLIYLFNKPEKFLEQIRQAFENKTSAKQITPPSTQKKPYKPEGPNIPSLHERIDYVFFTDLSSFRLSFKQGNLPFTLDWHRLGLSWKLVRLKLPANLV